MTTTTEKHFLFEQESGEVTSFGRSCWVASVFSQRSPYKDTPNEDATAVITLDDETAVFAVADGCGGMRGGEQAASIALKCLAQSVAHESADPTRLRVAILDGIESANEEILALRIGAACTIAIAEFHRGAVRTYHVGDSMVMLMSNRGRVRYQSICHSPVGFAIEAGFLKPEQAMHHEERHIVSNVVGDPRMRIEIGPTIEMSARDTLVIATDGLFDNLQCHEVVEVMRKGRLASSLHRLTQLAMARMLATDEPIGSDQDSAPMLPCKPDDLSVISIRRSN